MRIPEDKDKEHKTLSMSFVPGTHLKEDIVLLNTLHCHKVCCKFGQQFMTSRGVQLMRQFFFCLVFFSQTFTNYRNAGEGGGHFINSSLPLPPASQTLRN